MIFKSLYFFFLACSLGNSAQAAQSFAGSLPQASNLTSIQADETSSKVDRSLYLPKKLYNGSRVKPNLTPLITQSSLDPYCHTYLSVPDAISIFLKGARCIGYKDQLNSDMSIASSITKEPRCRRWFDLLEQISAYPDQIKQDELFESCSRKYKLLSIREKQFFMQYACGRLLPKIISCQADLKELRSMVCFVEDLKDSQRFQERSGEVVKYLKLMQQMFEKSACHSLPTFHVFKSINVLMQIFSDTHTPEYLRDIWQTQSMYLFISMNSYKQKLLMDMNIVKSIFNHVEMLRKMRLPDYSTFELADGTMQSYETICEMLKDVESGTDTSDVDISSL